VTFAVGVAADAPGAAATAAPNAAAAVIAAARWVMRILLSAMPLLPAGVVSVV
jgi:hypothetical protein